MRPRAPGPAGSAATRALLALLVFAPLAFGAVEPWSLALLETASFATLALALRSRGPGGVPHPRTVPGALPLCLFLGWLLLQALPLPPALVGAISPRALELWKATLGAAGPLPWVPLSLAPAETLRELLRFGACAACYAAAVLALPRPERLRPFLGSLAAFAGLLALLALLQAIAAPDRLLLLRPTGARHPFGPFANRNHFADLMAMLAPLLAGLTLSLPPPPRRAALRDRIAARLGRPESALRLLLGLATLLVLAALIASRSRGGTIAAGAGLLVFGAGVLALRLARGRAGAALALAGSAALLLGGLGWERVGPRFAESLAQPGYVDAARGAAWSEALRMAGDFPLAGSGLGSFATLHPRYRTIAGDWVFSHAHNDYLELLAGTGLPGVLLLGGFLAAAAAAVLRGLARGRDPACRRIAVGAAAGVSAFLVHGAGDFSLAVGANALWFFALLGVAVAAARAAAAGAGEPPSAPGSAPRGLVAAATAAAVLVAAGDASGLASRALLRLGHAEARRGAGTAPEARPRLAAAARLAPLAPEPRIALAAYEGRAGRLDRARREVRAALRLEPLAPATLALAGALAAAAGDEAAGAYYEQAAASDPFAPARRIPVAAWRLARGDRAGGLAALGEAMALGESGLSPALTIAGLYLVPLRELAAVVPERPGALRALAGAAEQAGEPGLAAELRRRGAGRRAGARRGAAAPGRGRG